MKQRGLVFLCTTVVALTMAIAPGRAGAAAAGRYRLIEGSGSTWASSMAEQSIVDQEVTGGPPVVYTSSGSTQGRTDFATRVTDFAVSDLPYQGTDPVTGESDTALGRPFAYVPLAAGGTAFPYQLQVGGRLVRNLRLSGRTLAKIFTNQISDWSDPAITADNNGHAFPSLPVIPVVHSEAAGVSAQFSAYLAKQYPADWAPFNGGRDTATAYFPRSGAAIAQAGSVGVMNYIASAAGNGAIGYDEYSYALGSDYPVAKVGNAAGYFTLPTAYNVAQSLTRAVVDGDPASPTYLTADLDNVYAFDDPRTYPLSSYSYLILPTGGNAEDSRLDTAKRQSLLDFVAYTVCAEQRSAAPVGYGMLPVNLVQAAFTQLRRLYAVDPGVDPAAADLGTCSSPTFLAGDPTADYLSRVAPLPAPCDQAGQGPCDGAGAGGGTGPGGAAITVQAVNATAPYRGDLSLSTTAGSAGLSQLDPGSAAGHPPLATNPTGHRHAWVFGGQLGGVAVTDTRPEQPGWVLTGEATDFVNGGTVVPGSELGWTPALGAGSDAEGTVVAGPPVDPRSRSGSGAGLAAPAHLATAAPGSGLGTENLTAALVFWIPDTSPQGTYTSIITLTLVSP